MKRLASYPQCQVLPLAAGRYERVCEVAGHYLGRVYAELQVN